MNKRVQLFVALLLILGFISFQKLVDNGVCDTVGAGDDSPMAAKVAELAPDNLSPVERIVALHRFVRDDIRQINARYG